MDIVIWLLMLCLPQAAGDDYAAARSLARDSALAGRLYVCRTYLDHVRGPRRGEEMWHLHHERDYTRGVVLIGGKLLAIDLDPEPPGGRPEFPIRR
jgi:hypothetical protein